MVEITHLFHSFVLGNNNAEEHQATLLHLKRREVSSLVKP